MAIDKTLALRVAFLLLAGAGCLASWALLSGLQSVMGAGLAIWLSAASYIDAQRYLLLDVFTLPLILVGLTLTFFEGMAPLLQSAIGAALGYLLFWAISEIYLKWRGRHGLGLGDAKLLAGAGAWCGVLALPMVVLIASISALTMVAAMAMTGRAIDARFKLPFGPFLGLGFFLTWLGLAVRGPGLF